MPVALFGAIPIAAAGAASYFSQQHDRPKAVISLAAGAAVLCTGMMGFAPVQLAPYQDSPYFAAAAQEATAFGQAEIASYDVFEPSLVFYHGRKVHRPGEPDHVEQFFAEHPMGLLLTRSDKLHRVPEDLGLVEITRQKRFLRRHDLVLLGRQTVMAAGHTEKR